MSCNIKIIKKSYIVIATKGRDSPNTLLAHAITVCDLWAPLRNKERGAFNFFLFSFFFDVFPFFHVCSVEGHVWWFSGDGVLFRFWTGARGMSFEDLRSTPHLPLEGDHNGLDVECHESDTWTILAGPGPDCCAIPKGYECYRPCDERYHQSPPSISERPRSFPRFVFERCRSILPAQPIIFYLGPWA